MVSIIGEKLANAIREKKEAKERAKADMNNWFWKGPKKSVAGMRMQNKIKLLDASLDELKEWYNHCYEMLYNEDKNNPGRYTLKEIVNNQIENCATELLIRMKENRYLSSDRESTPRTLFYKDLTALLNSPDTKGKFSIKEWNKIPISSCISNCPEEFRDVNVRSVLNGCLNSLGTFNRNHITLTFILKIGINLTDKELTELKAEAPNVMEAIKNRLKIPKTFNIKRNANGLSFKELQSIIRFKEAEYSTMSNDKLLVLKDKILPRLLNDIDNQIFVWEDLMDKLDQVAQKKFNVSLFDNNK